MINEQILQFEDDFWDDIIDVVGDDITKELCKRNLFKQVQLWPLRCSLGRNRTHPKLFRRTI